MPAAPLFKIIIYESLSLESTPEAGRYIAGLFIGYDAAARWSCSGATADAVREKMEAFWERERKSHEPRQAPKKEPKASLEAEDHAPAEVEDDDEVL